ncbi:MAG: purine-nucleoside phosphorylase, partial [bacterium]
MISSQLKESVAFIREQASLTPSIGIVLGSGLGSFADELPGRIAIPTSDIPHYPASTVEGHKGKLVFAMLGK